MSQRVGLVLSDEALAVIAANATERKRGEFVSNVLVDYARVMDSLSEADDEEDTGLLRRLHSQMARLEKQMALLLNKLED
jgi:hypothetical protein